MPLVDPDLGVECLFRVLEPDPIHPNLEPRLRRLESLSERVQDYRFGRSPGSDIDRDAIARPGAVQSDR